MTVALEEHFATQEIMDAWKKVDPRWRDIALKASTEGGRAQRLLDLGSERLAAMDAAGIDVAVLSLTTPGPQNLSADLAGFSPRCERPTGGCSFPATEALPGLRNSPDSLSADSGGGTGEGRA